MLKSLLLTLIFVPQISLAGFSLTPSYGVYKTDSNNNISQVELRVGYAFDFGLYLGGFYTLASQKMIENSDSFHLGVHVGYECHGLYGLLGYVAAGDQDLKSGGIKYANSKGMQYTVGYRLEMFEDIFLGPELTYRDVKYDSKETQGISAPVDRKDRIVIPSIALLFKF